MAEEFAVTHALSLTQPWASLMEFDEKKNETRCWRTSFRGWFAIHAAKGYPKWCERLCHDPEHFWPSLHRHQVAYPENLPRGVVIAIAKLVDCRRTEDVRSALSSQELAFGDYSDGRFAFITESVRALKVPIPMRGALNFWKMLRPITVADLTGDSAR